MAEGPRTEPFRLDDLQVTDSAYGNTIPIALGTQRLSGNVIWSTDIRETKTTRRKREGGKGGLFGGGRGSDTVYVYHASFAVALAEGPATELISVWIDNKLVYSAKGEKLDVEGIGFDFYEGTETQGQAPTIAFHNPDTPAFRGICYIVFPELELNDFGSRIPQVTCEVSFPTATKGIQTRAAGLGNAGITSLVVDWKRRRFYGSFNNDVYALNVDSLGSFTRIPTGANLAGSDLAYSVHPSTGAVVFNSIGEFNPYTGARKPSGNVGQEVKLLTDLGTDYFYVHNAGARIEDTTAGTRNTIYTALSSPLSNTALGRDGLGEAFVFDTTASKIICKRLRAIGVDTLFEIQPSALGFTSFRTGRGDALYFDNESGDFISFAGEGSTYKLFRVSPAGVVAWSTTITGFSGSVTTSFYSYVRGGHLTFAAGGTVIRANLSDGTIAGSSASNTTGVQISNTALDAVYFF